MTTLTEDYGSAIGQGGMDRSRRAKIVATLGPSCSTIEVFRELVRAGLDVARLRRDMTAPDVSDEIIANFNLARGIRVFQTPAFIVGGRLMNSESASIDFPKAVAAARHK